MNKNELHEIIKKLYLRELEYAEQLPYINDKEAEEIEELENESIEDIVCFFHQWIEERNITTIVQELKNVRTSYYGRSVQDELIKCIESKYRNEKHINTVINCAAEEEAQEYRSILRTYNIIF